MSVEPANARATDPVRIGSRLAAARKARGLSQYAVAKLTRISRPNVARSERGAHSQSLSVIERYCNAIGVSVLDILGDGTLEVDRG